MKVLAIGNSFSQDAMALLSQVAKANGENIKCVNLYIGGCSLEQHHRYMLGESSEYSFEINGITNTGIKISLKEALLSDAWDYITLQQVSYCSPRYETYQPYLNTLAEYVKKHSPRAKIYIHETWAYEDDSYRLNSELHYEKSKDMYDDLKEAYSKAAKAIGADGIIRCGTAFEYSKQLGEINLHRDTFHASIPYGRYLLALTWYITLVGGTVNKETYKKLELPLTEHQAKIALKSAQSAVESI